MTSWLEPKTWSLRTRVTALCTAAAVVLTLLAASAAGLARANQDNLDTLLNRIGVLRTNGEKLTAALSNQQSAMRGYVLLQRESDLQSYLDGQKAEDAIYDVITPLAAGEPGIAAPLQAVKESSRRWHEQVAEPAIAEVKANGPEAAQALLARVTGDYFKLLEADIAQLQSQVLVLRNEAVAAVNSTSDTLTGLLIIAALVVLLTGVALVVLLHRTVTRPVTHLAEQVRRVAEGDYERRIEGQGAPDLIHLASDVDGMRRRIAADLAEVRRARQLIEETNLRLEIQAAELSRSNRDLEQFAYVASHDLQEPLRKVASFCQLLQRRYSGQLDERADQYIWFAVDGAQRMQRLINDLLAFSRIGRTTSGFGRVSLGDVMSHVDAQLESARKYAKGTLVWSDLPTVFGEESLLATLLANLAGNSLKFRRPGVTPRVEVSAEQVDDHWQITVKDNGIGIEPEYADKIFVIFQRLHAKDAYPGTGIGLAIAKKIVEHHGGKIWVSTTAGDGAAITFTLPVHASELGSALPPGDPAPGAPAEAPAPADPEHTAPADPEEIHA